MKRINRPGLTVIHGGQHFELPNKKRPICHGYSRTCRCDTCKRREARAQQKRVALPWEQDYDAA